MQARTASALCPWPAAREFRRGRGAPPPPREKADGSADRGVRAPAPPRRQRPRGVAGASLAGRPLYGVRRPTQLAAELAGARGARDPLRLVEDGRPAGDVLARTRQILDAGGLDVARLVAHCPAAGQLHSRQQLGRREGSGQEPA